jgi:3-oxoacyl-ACP reductase-like protein
MKGDRQMGAACTCAVMSWNQSEVMEARQITLETAKGVLSGTVSSIEGARTIARHRFTASLENDPDILPFVGETEVLPRGNERTHWQARTLADLQPTIDEAQSWARKVGASHCQNLLARSASLLRWPD